MVLPLIFYAFSTWIFRTNVRLTGKMQSPSNGSPLLHSSYDLCHSELDFSREIFLRNEEQKKKKKKKKKKSRLPLHNGSRRSERGDGSGDEGDEDGDEGCAPFSFLTLSCRRLETQKQKGAEVLHSRVSRGEPVSDFIENQNTERRRRTQTDELDTTKVSSFSFFFFHYLPFSSIF